MYARAVRSLRLRELQNVECMTAVHAGLGSIIPLQLLTMLSPLEMELRTCGLPYINLEFLKVMHTFVWKCLLKYVYIKLQPPHIIQPCSGTFTNKYVRVSCGCSTSLWQLSAVLEFLQLI